MYPDTMADVHSPEAENSMRTSKRRRIKTSRFEAEFIENEEHMMLQQVRGVSFLAYVEWESDCKRTFLTLRTEFKITIFD
jgi:hypothetical protein